MMFVPYLYFCSLLAVLAGYAAAVPAAHAVPRVAMETDVAHPSSGRPHWTPAGTTPPGRPLRFTAALKLRPAAAAQLEDAFWAVSDPSHPDYGRHWSQDAVRALLAPPSHHTAAVGRFLAQHGATTVDWEGELVAFELTAAAANEAFGTSFHAFRHTDGRVLHRAARGYTLPADVADAINTIDGVVRLPYIRAGASSLKNPKAHRDDDGDPFPASASCGGKCTDRVTPAILTARYNLGPAPAAGAVAANSSMAVAEFQDQGWDQADCDKLAAACQTQNITVNHQLPAGEPSGGPSTEGLLDIQYIKALGGAIPLTNIYSEPYSLLNWAKALSGMPSPPLVNSVSYGNDEVQQTGVAYMESCNTQFKALGVRGISILFASGDDGVCGRSGCGLFTTKFHPGFPAASPYVTSVGGTDFATKSVIGDETAWSGSGGGFSNTFGIPDYQRDAVAAYQQKCPTIDCPPFKAWNATGRGFPDIAALGGKVNLYCVVEEGSFGGADGTSAATPVNAAVFAKLNDIRLRAGKPPLGFLNPWLYANAAAFNDVTTGCNNGGSKHGFTATDGWDPATGLGTPNFEALSKLV